MTLRHEFHSLCATIQRNGELSHPDVNGALDAVKELDNYQHDYNERNFFFLKAVITTSSACFTYCPTVRSRTISRAWASSTQSPPAFKQR